jgi:hypothetical protein
MASRRRAVIRMLAMAIFSRDKLSFPQIPKVTLPQTVLATALTSPSR